MNNSMGQIIQHLGVPRLLTMLVVSLSIIIAFVLLSTQINKPEMNLLYGGLTPKEASQITEKLSSLSVKYEIRGESNIYVPADKVGQLRLTIAGEGLVGNSIKGYEIFDESSSFGTTSLVQDLNSKRALEGELAKTIMSLPVVSNARVHLVIPKKRLFLKDQTPPSASVVLNVGARVLEEGQVNSILHMVASAVPGLKPENVSIVDNRGKLLSYGNDQTNIAKLTNAQKYKQKVEQQYKNQLTIMLEKIIGIGKVSVQVSADIDLNKIEETSEIYDPSTQVVRSEQVNEETVDSVGTTTSMPTGTSSNLDRNNNSATNGVTSRGPSESQARNQSTINYEISKTVRHSVKNVGQILNLSVAVVLEGNYSTDENGDRVYVPLTEDQLSKIRTLVQSSIGFNEERGDVVEVIDLPFSDVEELEEPEKALISSQDIIKIAESAMMLIGFIAMIIFVIKPILSTANTVVQSKMPAREAEPQIVANVPSQESTAEEIDDSFEDDSLVNVTNVEGKVREASIKKAANIIENHPDESTQVIRRWMLGDIPSDSK